MKVSWGKSKTVQFCNANMANLAIRIEVSARVKHMNFDDLVLLRLMKIPYPGPRLAYTSSINVIFSWRISNRAKNEPNHREEKQVAPHHVIFSV